MNSGTQDTSQAIGLLRRAADAMRSVTTSAGDELRAIHTSVNALQAREAELLADMDEARAYETDGAASIAMWASRELHLDPKTTRQLVRAAKTMRDMPKIANAARAGSVSVDQVHALTYSLKHVGHEETVNVEDQLVVLTQQLTPTDLFAAMRQCKAIAHPDELDKAWLAGMDKEDIQCLPVGDGFHTTGFLGIDHGAMLATFLKSASVPRDAADTRTNAQRRIDAFGDMLRSVLDSGLPADAGVRPHLTVVVDADQPPTLDGFGVIGPALAALIATSADITNITTTGPNHEVLNVGRTKGLPPASKPPSSNGDRRAAVPTPDATTPSAKSTTFMRGQMVEGLT